MANDIHPWATFWPPFWSFPIGTPSEVPKCAFSIRFMTFLQEGILIFGHIFIYTFWFQNILLVTIKHSATATHLIMKKLCIEHCQLVNKSLQSKKPSHLTIHNIHFFTYFTVYLWQVVIISSYVERSGTSYF